MIINEINPDIVYELLDEIREMLTKLTKDKINNEQEQPELNIDFTPLTDRMQAIEDQLNIGIGNNKKEVLSEIQGIKRITSKMQYSNNGVTSTDLNALYVKIKELLLTQDKNVRKIPFFSFDVDSGRFIIVFFLIFIGLGVSLSWNGRQLNTNREIKEKDLRYRYILKNGYADPEDLMWLEAIFGENRNEKEISRIKKEVSEFERISKEIALKKARLRLEERETEKLKKKVEVLKKTTNK